MSVEEKVRVEEEQDSDEFMNKLAAVSCILVNSERAVSNSCTFVLYINKLEIMMRWCSLTVHIEHFLTWNTIVKCPV